MNTTQLIGRLTKDPELRFSPSGIAICNFTVAVQRDFKNQQGEYETDFITCKVFKKQAENLANYQKKGDRIGIVGRIQTGSYEGQDGKRVYTTEVIANSIEFLESKRNNAQGNQTQNTNYQSTQINSNIAQNSTRVDEDPFAPVNNGRTEVTEEDLPF